MKKMILLSAMALVAAGASAQYTCDPTTEALLEQGTPSKMWYITLSDTSVDELTKKGTDMIYVGPSPEEGRNFWYWAGWIAGPENNPRVGMEDGGYMSLTVTGDAGWSGGGVAINGPLSTDAKGPGVNLEGLNDDTRFHFAYCTNGTAPASVGLILLDDSANGSIPAKFSFGSIAFDVNGVIYPRIADTITDEWQGVDISFSDIKKLWPSFAPANLNAWGGNILSMLSGNIAQSNFCMDAIYLYNSTNSGVEGVAEDATIVITDNTINALGANGIEVYDLAGRKVAATEGTVLGLNNLTSGVYVAKTANTVKKFVVK